MIVNEVSQWCREVYYIQRVINKLLRISYAHPRVVAAYHEMQLAHTATRLAYKWLELYVKQLSDKYEVEVPDLTEDDPLPDLYRDFSAITRFIIGQLDSAARNLRGEQPAHVIPLSNTFTANAEAQLINALFLMQLVIEDATIKYDEGNIEV